MSAALHRPVGGSNIHRVMRCRASLLAEENFKDRAPREDSKDAAQGRLAHEILERAIKQGLSNVSHLYGLDDEITADIIASVNEALEAVREIYARLALSDSELSIYSEQGCSLPGAEDVAGGRIDIRISSPSGVECIIDFKNGVTLVEADADQTLYYAACQTLSPQCESVECVVIQPNGFHRNGTVRSHVWSREEVEAFRGRALKAIQEALDPYAPFSPSHEACHNCAAAPSCRALADAVETHLGVPSALEVAKRSGVLPLPSSLSSEKLGALLRAAPIIRDWLSAVEKDAALRAINGTHIQGFKLVARKVARELSMPGEEAALILASLTTGNVEDYMTRRISNLKTLESTVKESLKATGVKRGDIGKLTESIMSRVTHKPVSSEPTLVSDDDPRPQWTQGGEDFKSVTFNPGT